MPPYGTTPPVPPVPLSREAVDQELARLEADAGRVSDALVELTEYNAYKLLESAPLSGTTAERWQRVSAKIAALWDDFTAYQDVLNRAKEIRGRRVKPRPEDLAAITGLIKGASITLSTKAVALSERTLLGPSSITETATLAQTLARMNTDYQLAADFIAQAETAWNRLFAAADPVQERLKRLGETARGIGDRSVNTAVAGLIDGYAELRREIFADPLGLAAPGSTFPGRLAEIDRRIGVVAEAAAHQADLRADYERGTEHLRQLVERVDEVEAAQRSAARTVREKILVESLPAFTAQAPALRARLSALDELRTRGQWARLTTEAEILADALDAALAAATKVEKLISGLLERREELRGRLQAYRVRAARHGAAESQPLEAYYQTARELLWSRPCDLAAATRALSTYQKAVLALDQRAR
jgi:hypothetical protein